MSETEVNIPIGIVVFGPDLTVIRLIDTVLAEAPVIFVLVNGLIDRSILAEMSRRERLVIIQSAVNVGVGQALNKLAEEASRCGFRHIQVFDQDSSPPEGLSQSLAALFTSLSNAGKRVAALGPTLTSPVGIAYKTPRYFQLKPSGHSGCSPVHYLPTSGTLISIDAFREIGPFRDDYFIDGIDLEWCFRAWSKGYSCWLATAVTMEHTVGEGSVGAFGFRTPHQKDFRLETYVRNTVYGFRLPHIPLSWKLRQGAYLVAQVALLSVANRFRPSLLKRLGRGFVNGLRGRLGPPEGVPFT